MQLHQSDATNTSSGNSFENTEAQRFLTILDPNADEFDFRFIHPHGAKTATNLRGSLRVCDFAASDANTKGYGVFVTVNRTDGKGFTRKNITDIRAVYADFDYGIPQNLPLPPSMIVETSPGKAQYYWLVDDDMSAEQFKGIMGRRSSKTTVPTKTRRT